MPPFFLYLPAKCATMQEKQRKAVQKMGYIPAVFAAYLLGCSSMALYIAKRKQVDLRSGGSGNLGTSNVVAVIGWAEGLLVALHDVGKGALAVFLAQLCFPALPEIARQFT